MKKLWMFLLVLIILGFENQINAIPHSLKRRSQKDSISSTPWMFERKIKSIALPDSLSNGKVNGSAILLFIISKEGILKEIQIGRLILKQKPSEIQCSDFADEDVPQECSKYLTQYKDFFNKYFSKIRIVRNIKSPQPVDKSKMGLQIKLTN